MRLKDPLRNPLLFTLLVFATFDISIGIVILLAMSYPLKPGIYPLVTITCRNRRRFISSYRPT